MKSLKKIVITSFCLVLALSCFAGCHKKDEIAVKVGDYEFTGAYYSCALCFADTEARQKVRDDLTAKGKSIEDVNYFNKKVDGKDFVKWVEEKAIENIKENAGYKALCKENDIKMTDEQKAEALSLAQNYWTGYGYEQIFTENGVSAETFNNYMLDNYYSKIYFNAIHGKDGKNPVSEEELKKTLLENYVLIEKIEENLGEADDKAKEEARAKYQGYLEAYNSGEKTFEEIYSESTGKDIESVIAERSESFETEEKPANVMAELVGNDKTALPFDKFDEAVKMQQGEAKLMETEDTLYLVIKLDATADPYYLSANDEFLRQIFVGDSDKDAALKKGNELSFKKNESAIKLFKVKKIKYPDSITVGG